MVTALRAFGFSPSKPPEASSPTLLTAVAAALIAALTTFTARADTFGSGGGGLYSPPYGEVGYEYRLGVTEVAQHWIEKATSLGMDAVTAGAVDRHLAGGWASRVANWAGKISGKLLAPDGRELLDFAKLEDGFFKVEVPVGADAALWKPEPSVGQRLMTVPPYLARTGEELLLPREVVDADGKR